MEIGKKITSETDVALIQAASTAVSTAAPEVLGDYLLEPASKNPLSKSQRGDRLIRINLSRNTLIAIMFSLLIHGLILLTVVPQINFDNAAAPQPQAIEVSLVPPKSAQVIEPKPQEKQQEAPKVKPPKTIRPS
ncbi:MAG: hypothetical protein RIS87_1042, partial [Pseudomonadota bacterium]